MARLISTLPVGKALLYIDDVLLYSKDVAKSELLWTEVKYLGFVMGKNSILMNPKYRQALIVSSTENTKSPGEVPGDGPVLQALPQEFI